MAGMLLCPSSSFTKQIAMRNTVLLLTLFILSFLVSTHAFAQINETATPTPSLFSRFEAYLNTKAQSGTASDKTRIESFRTMLAAQGTFPQMPGGGITVGLRSPVAQPNELNIDAEIIKLEDEAKELSEKGEQPDFRKTLALALLHRQKGDMLKAVEYLDALPLTASGDIRYREQVVLKLFPGHVGNAEMRKRVETAADRLLRFQLNGAEMKDLRQALRLLSRNEEADKIRDRMLVTVTDLQTQYELLNELRGDANKERTVQFALRLFRSSAVRNAATSTRNDYARVVRDATLDILQQHGKLTEIVEQIEAQWKSSPGSIDIMTALADIYNKAGRKDDAKKIAIEIGEKMPDDAAKMQVYANLLRNLGMNEEAAEWTIKAFSKNPEQILQNFYQYEQNFRNSNQIPQLIAILKTIPPQRIAQQFSQISSRMTEWQRTHKDATKELLDYIWAMEGASDDERRQGRANFVRSMASNATPEAYPMFREVILDAVSPREPTVENNQQQSMTSPFSVYSWSMDRCWCVATTFFDLVANKTLLEDTRKDFQQVVEDHEAMDENKRDKNLYRNARLALAMNEIRLGNAEAAVTLIEAVWKEGSGGQDPRQQAIQSIRGETTGLVLGLELAKLDNHPEAVELAITLFEEQLKSSSTNQPWMGRYAENIIVKPLFRLYAKTGRAGAGRDLALNKLRESFHYLRLCDANGQYQAGNRYYSAYELQESALTMSQALLESEAAFDLMMIYREMYDGQPWVRAMRERQNYRLNALDALAKGLESKVSTTDFVANLERLIPGMAQTTNEIDVKTALPMTLGGYILPVSLPPEKNDAGAASTVFQWFKLIRRRTDHVDPAAATTDDVPVPEGQLAGIRLVDALVIVAKENPDRYAAAKKQLEALEKAAPDEPSVLIVLTSCRLIDGDRTAVESLLRRCAEWAKSDKATGEINQQIYLGFWSLLKRTFADEALMAKPEVRVDAETLFHFVGRLVGRISNDMQEDRRIQLTGHATPVQSFLFDVRRHAPEEFNRKFQPDFEASVFERILMPVQGYLTRSLDTQRHRIAEQLSEGVALAPGPVMQVFRNVFATGFPMIEGGGSLSRENSMLLLFVFSKVFEAARNAEVEPVIVYEALLGTVLPVIGTQPFLADYGDLGGENGYFRTTAADLVDWALAANKVDDLKERIALKRTHPNTEMRLDVVDLLLALKTNDTERSNELIAKFLKGVRDNDPQLSMLAAMAAVPAAKPFEFSEITEHYPVLIALIDAIVTNEAAQVGKRYVYYIIRSFYDRFEKEVPIPQKIRWLERYRKITNVNQMDGFRFTSEDRLYREGLAADKLDDAVAVLRYFASCPVGQFRYRDLTEYIATLEPKLAALEATNRQELLGDFDWANIAQQGEVKRAGEKTLGLVVKDFGLPPLPEGTVVYQNDFEKPVGSEWSMGRRDTPPKIDKTFLGEFHSERVRLRLTDLPEHRFVRIRFDLLMLGGIDGLVGQPREFGPDIWGMEITGSAGTSGSKPIVSTFSNFNNDPNAQTQSFPDDFPLEFGVKPAWFEQFISDRLWLYSSSATDFGKGVYHGRFSAMLENKLGYEKDSVYAIDVVVPHTGSDLSIEFFTNFRDGPYGNNAINLTLGESWGLDNFRVETINDPFVLDDAALKKCFDALIGDDAIAAAQARWRLVAADNAAVKYIDGWFQDETNAAKRTEIQKSGNFDLFRIDRVLQLIATPEAEALRKEIAK